MVKIKHQINLNGNIKNKIYKKMNKKSMLDLLKNIKEDKIFEPKIHDRVLIIDGLNLFFFS